MIDLYTEWKTVYVDFSERLQKAQIEEYLCTLCDFV